MTDTSEAAIEPAPPPHRDLRFRHFRPDLTMPGIGDIAGDLVGCSEIIRDPDGESRAAAHLADRSVRPEPGGWQDENGTRVLPVARLREAS